MCTAISYNHNSHYFGRNLDLEYHYDTAVTICPRNFPLIFRHTRPLNNHFSMIGMAYVNNNYPLFYEATNEHGLSIAGLNFPDNAVYYPMVKNMDNITPFELIPWILGQCKTISDTRQKLSNLNLINENYSNNLQLSPLHWLISDHQSSLVLEPMASGIKIYENPIQVLTNNPPFPYHMHNIANYMNLTAEAPVNRFSEHLNLKAYSRGMGAIGLPGDLSSASRFIKAAFVLHNSISDDTEVSNVSQFFHILDSVKQQEGCNKLGQGYEKTIYSSCCNITKGIYYYKTYSNSRITAINMHSTDLNCQNLQCFPLRYTQDILREN